jgi:spore coat polysaccharide biosynthesis predicted glycosyltransferase SpsG
MLKVGEYEANATACRRLAAQTKNLKLKKQLDDMAEMWDRLARQGRQGVVENNPEQT